MGLYQNVFESADGGVYINTRDGSGTGITSTTVSAKQGLDVNIINAIQIGVADESAFTYGTSMYQPIGGVYSSSITALTTGEGGVVALTAKRAMYASLFDTAGNSLGGANASGLWIRPGDGTNAQAYASSGEAYTSIREGGNVATVNASNQLLVLDGNAGSILALMTPTTGTLTQVAVTTSTGPLLASNSSRKGWSVQNDTNKIIYIAVGATASVTAYTVRIAANGYYESLGERVTTAALAVIGATGVTGNAIVTEYT